MPESNRLHAFKLDRRGLARFFGEREAEVMEAVWDLGEPTVAQVCRRLGPKAHYKTVMTVMNRLVEKGALTRRRVSRAYAYSAAEARAAFEERVTRRVAEGLVREFGDLAVAQFVDALDAVDPELIDELRRVLQDHAEDAHE